MWRGQESRWPVEKMWLVLCEARLQACLARFSHSQRFKWMDAVLPAKAKPAPPPHDHFSSSLRICTSRKSTLMMLAWMFTFVSCLLSLSYHLRVRMQAQKMAPCQVWRWRAPSPWTYPFPVLSTDIIRKRFLFQMETSCWVVAICVKSEHCQRSVVGQSCHQKWPCPFFHFSKSGSWWWWWGGRISIQLRQVRRWFPSLLGSWGLFPGATSVYLHVEQASNNMTQNRKAARSKTVYHPLHVMALTSDPCGAQASSAAARNSIKPSTNTDPLKAS